MVRMLAFLLVLCVAFPVSPVTAAIAPAEMITTDCHNGNSQDRHESPVDRQSKHICLGCAVLAPRIELAVPRPMPLADGFARITWWLADNIDAVDLPPPRAEG